MIVIPNTCHECWNISNIFLWQRCIIYTGQFSKNDITNVQVINFQFNNTCISKIVWQTSNFLLCKCFCCYSQKCLPDNCMFQHPANSIIMYCGKIFIGKCMLVIYQYTQGLAIANAYFNPIPPCKWIPQHSTK